MTLKHLISILGAGLLWSGCVTDPPYARPPAPVAGQFPGHAATQPGTNAAADLAWRDFFADERLKKLIELALANNRDLRVAALNVEQSRAQYRITKADSYPGAQAAGSYTRSGNSRATTDQWNASVGTTSYELDFFGHVRSLNSQALENYFATEEARRSSQISLVAEVATQYFTQRQLEEQIQVTRQTLTAVEESYRVNRIRFDVGENNELDLRSSEGQVQTARINLSSYQRQLAQAINYLVLLVGQPLPDDLPAPRAFGDTNLVAEIPAGLPSDLLQRRPDLLEAEHTLKAANANIGAARAAFFPTISLTASTSSSSAQLAELFSAGTGMWSFSPQISVPIFTGGRNRANFDAAKISARIEVANYEKAIQTAFREVADALAGSSGYREQLPQQQALVNAQQRRLELATLRYRNGEDSYLNELSAQQDLFNAQQGLLQLQFNILSSDITLYKTLGGGWK